MIQKFSRYFLFIFLLSYFLQKTEAQLVSIPELFENIATQSEIIKFRNELDVNNRGGHLQGIQLYNDNGVEYIVLSGSSGTYAYSAMLRIDDSPKVQSINKLMYKPFKHAGGFQIYQDLLAVGIEDNDARDKSKICIYSIDDPEEAPLIPLAIIEREGDPFRSTAGCIGITKIKEQYLLVAGDWDTKHLDFYLFDDLGLKQGLPSINKSFTIDTDSIDKSTWSNKQWYAYQNVNLLNDTDGTLYLIGFARNDRSENIADLYRLETNDNLEFRLTKINSKRLKCRKGADFKSGAGSFFQPGLKLEILSCGSHIGKNVKINVFD